MKIRTMENLVGIALDVTGKELKRAMKYNPNICCLYDDDTEAMIFRVGIADDASLGDINDYGATFAIVNERPLLWLAMPTTKSSDKKTIVEEEYGVALSYLMEVEEQIKACIEGINERVEALTESIIDCDK